MTKAVKKGLIITAIVLGSIVGLLLILYGVLWIVRAASYGESNGEREFVCTVPEINSGYAPQGIGYSEEKDLFIQTGYDKNDDVVLFIIKDDKPTRIKLKGADGETLKGHAGGVTISKDNVYIANGDALDVFSLDEMLQKGEATARSSFPVHVGAAYVFSTADRIYVGEFYRAGNYETPEAHHYTTPNGALNRAIVVAYPLDESGAICGAPQSAISIPDLVQGFVEVDGTIVLSRSYGLKNSVLDYHTAPADSGTTVEVNTAKGDDPHTLPLSYLDASNTFKTLTLPAFSEDLTLANGRVVVTNESACNKYIVGKFFGGNKVYSFPVYKAETN